MSKRLGDLEAGALSAWTPAQQAALYHQHLARQAEEDEKAQLAEWKEEERNAKRPKPDKPEKVEAGKVVDHLLKDRIPPLYNFLDSFGPPHLGIIPFVALHLVFWLVSPWYLHHLIPYPMVYLVPMIATASSVRTRKDRALWQSWWVELVLVEYLETLLFRGEVRSLVWWPKIKAVVFVCLYCVVDKDKKSRKPIYTYLKGAMKIMTPWLSSLSPGEDEDKAKDKDRARDKDKVKDREAKEKERARAKEKEREAERERERGKARAKA